MFRLPNFWFVSALIILFVLLHLAPHSESAWSCPFATALFCPALKRTKKRPRQQRRLRGRLEMQTQPQGIFVL